MIAFVKGPVAAVTLSSAVIEVGGVGLELICTPGTLATLRTGQVATLPTSMVVREDSLTLFGFLDEDEKGVFELVQTASGVGPKLAQAMLAVLSPDTCAPPWPATTSRRSPRCPASARRSPSASSSSSRTVSAAPSASVGRMTLPASETWRDQVHQGLTGLGWPAREAERAVDSVADQAGDQPDVGALLRMALQTLSRA